MRARLFLLRYSGLALAALCAPALSIRAQGFQLNEIGSCAVGRGFAVTAAPCNDASVLFWNPAAAAALPGRTLTVGGATVAVHGGFTRDTSLHRYGSNIAPTLVPHGFFNAAIGRVALGLGVYVPYGLTSQWNSDFPGRFSALKASLRTVYIQPNVAFQLDPNWQVGFGPVFGHSQVQLIQALDLSQQVAAAVNGMPVTFGQLGIAGNTEFARAELRGSADAVGINVGLHGQFGGLSLGARYLSPLNFQYGGAKVTFTPLATGLILAANNPVSTSPVPVDVLLASQFAGTGALTAQTGSSRIEHPWQAVAGLGYSGLLGTTISADVARIGWSSFGQLPISFNGPARGSSRSLIEDYHDSWSYRVGAEHTINAIAALRGWTGRIGYTYTQTPAPAETVTPLLPDMDRDNVSLGLAIPFVAGHLDASYLHVSTPGRRGRVVERTSATQAAAQLNSGAYDLAANVVSLTYTARF